MDVYTVAELPHPTTVHSVRRSNPSHFLYLPVGRSSGRAPLGRLFQDWLTVVTASAVDFTSKERLKSPLRCWANKVNLNSCQKSWASLQACPASVRVSLSNRMARSNQVYRDESQLACFVFDRLFQILSHKLLNNNPDV